jgi:hypothetical protein
MTVDVPSDKCINATVNMKVRLLVILPIDAIVLSMPALTIIAGFRDCGSPEWRCFCSA